MSELYRRERKYKKINSLLLAVLVLVTGWCGFLALRRNDGYAAFQAVLALVMYTFPALITVYIRFIIPQDLRLLYYIFTFSTVVVGSAMYGYSYIPYWDKIFHFFSGILISAAGLIVCQLLFCTLRGGRKPHMLLYILFPFLFNLSVAALWEVYEYMLYIIFGVDAVNNLTTGVHDTMQDIIVCLAGGILFSASLLRSFYRQKYSFILNVCRHFFDMRGQKLEIGE